MVFEQKCSFYSNVRKANCVEMTLEEFVARIKNGSWKAPVEMYQRLMAEGEKSKAKELKNKLPGLVVAGYCEGSHAMKNLRSWSGDTMLDMDLTLGRAAEFLEMLKPVPWIKAGWRSVSYDGLKVVVRIEAEDPEEYAVAYAVVAWHIERIIEFGCDMCCKNPTRLCYASYDELAFYKDDAPVFPWRDFVEQNPDVANELLPPAMRRTPFAEAAEAAAQTAAEHTPAPGMLRALFNDFLARNPFVEGARNEFLLKLGRVARYKGLSESELQQLVALAVERLADAGCPPQDIGPKIKSGYRYVDLNSTPENQDLNPRFSRSKAQGPLCENFGPRGKEEKTENERLEEDKLKKAVPFFPKTVYDNLPDLIQRGLKAAHSNREKDRLLLGMLVNLSACMPGVWMSYSDEYCTPHFYALNLAGAGRGKGVVTLGAILPDAIQRYLDGKNRQAWTEYEKKRLAWQLEERNAIREKRVPNIDMKPEPPARRMLKISPNISKSQLIIALEEAGEQGVVINASELDMLTNAMKQDCGKHDDVMRAAFHHEEVSSYYKVDKRMVMAHMPRLALNLAGTPAQLHRFISSLENGMYSRMAFYIGQGSWSWRSAAPSGGRQTHIALFRELSEEVLRMFVFLSESPTEVRLTPEQWEEHTQRFSGTLREVVSEEDDSQGAIVYRHGLIAARIAMVLTAMRKCEPMWNVPECYCTDEDFHTAMDMAAVLLDHSLLLSTSFQNAQKGRRGRPMKKFYRIRSVLAEMPDRFTFSELLAVALIHGIPATTLKRYLVRLIEMDILVKEGNMYCKTFKPWPKNPK